MYFLTDRTMNRLVRLQQIRKRQPLPPFNVVLNRIEEFRRRVPTGKYTQPKMRDAANQSRPVRIILQPSLRRLAVSAWLAVVIPHGTL